MTGAVMRTVVVTALSRPTSKSRVALRLRVVWDVRSLCLPSTAGVAELMVMAGHGRVHLVV